MSLAKVAVVIGAGPGVGLSVAKKFAKEGYAIALVARSKEKLVGYQKEIAGSQVFAADAGNETSLKTALDEVKKSLGTPEVVVYNAAALKQGRLESITVTDFENDFKVNVTGALIASQHYLNDFKSAKKGTILLTGGGLAFGPMPAYSLGALAIGKASIRSLAQSLHFELKPSGIHVATVTICGMVKPGTPYDPDTIALDYWKLHSEDPASWSDEIVFKKN